MYKYTFYMLVLSLLFIQCEEEEFGPVLSLNSSPSWSAPANGSSFVLTEESSEDIVTTFSWTAADFGFPAGVEYTLELDVEGNDFAEAVTLGTVNKLTYNELSVGKLNNILLAKELVDGVASTVEVRVCASVGEDAGELCSETLSLSVTPYKTEVEVPVLNMPGSYQGWDPAKEETAIYSRKSNEIYEGYVFIGEADAKYKFAKGSWDMNWGDDGNDGSLEPAGSDIALNNQPGMFFFMANLNTLAHSNMRADWGLIGSATPTGWDSDTDMVWDEEKGVLTITIDLVPGEFKFRANDAWNIDFGDNFGNKKLQQGGENIAVDEAGNYTIELDLSSAEYTYSITKN